MMQVSQAARVALREALEREGVEPQWVEYDRAALDTSAPLLRFGSPTIFVEGVDVAGEADMPPPSPVSSLSGRARTFRRPVGPRLSPWQSRIARRLQTRHDWVFSRLPSSYDGCAWRFPISGRSFQLRTASRLVIMHGQPRAHLRCELRMAEHPLLVNPFRH
jgi:hypothetical protein